MPGNPKSLSSADFNNTATLVTIPQTLPQADDEERELLAKLLIRIAGLGPPTTGTGGGTGAVGAAGTTFDLTTSGAGTIPAGYYYAEIYNAGGATGVVNSQSLPVATVKSYPTIPGVYLPAITYDATGTILVITAVRA